MKLESHITVILDEREPDSPETGLGGKCRSLLCCRS